jgi:5-methylcytosine-specific restriction endonuclease McrA
MNAYVLLLNASEEVLNVIPWQRAAKLLASGKATKPYNYEDSYRIPTGSAHYEIPSAIILRKYIRVPFTPATMSRKNIMKRDGNACQYCDQQLDNVTHTIDHVIPRSKGGKHVWENIVSCCGRCNAKKADKTLADAGMHLKIQPFVPTRETLVTKSIKSIKNESWSRFVDF